MGDGTALAGEEEGWRELLGVGCVYANNWQRGEKEELVIDWQVLTGRQGKAEQSWWQPRQQTALVNGSSSAGSASVGAGDESAETSTTGKKAAPPGEWRGWRDHGQKRIQMLDMYSATAAVHLHTRIELLT